MAEAPLMVDRLDQADAEHFAEVRSLLDQAGVAYALDGTLVRGLDYYTRTVFEFESEAPRRPGGDARRRRALRRPGRGARRPADARLRLGRRDRADPARARTSRSRSRSPTSSSPRRSGQSERAFALVRELRGAGLRAELDLAGRSLKGQMKQADRIGARAHRDPRRATARRRCATCRAASRRRSTSPARWRR